MSIISGPKRIKREYICNYLLNVVKDIEKFSTDHSVWAVRPDIIYILTKLLCNGKTIIFDGSVTKRLDDSRMFLDFYVLDEMEDYFKSFMKQSATFVNGESNSKPKIIYEIKEDLEIRILDFLKSSNDDELLKSLQQIQILSRNIHEYLLRVTPARRDILTQMLVPQLTSLLTIVETIYGVLNET